MRNYKKIIAWQRAHALTIEIYSVSKSFPVEEKYGVTSQVRRAAYSVPANITEGAVRSSGRDYLRFLNIARSSLAEVEYFVLLARDLGYLQRSSYAQLTESVRRVFAPLSGLIRSVEKENEGKHE